MNSFYYISKTLGFLSTPTNGLLVLLLVGIATLRWRFGRRLTVLSAVLLVVCGLSPAANLLMAPLEQRFPRWDASRGAPDGIVVLG
ncbi:MAG: YdcF family protein, partial [Bacteroidales bacterium]|nr:YdcF family protein [Bacteroidales bacterium]